MQKPESRSRAILENMREAVVVYEVVGDGEDFIFKDYNGGAERLDNVDRSEVIGRSVFDVFPGVKDFGLIEVLREVWRTGRAQSLPFSYYKDHRVSGWRTNHVFKISSEEVVAVYSDETDLKRSQNALLASEARYRHFYEKAPVMIHSIDVDARIVDVNELWLKNLGYERAEVIGRRITSFFEEESRAYIEKTILPQFFRQGQTREVPIDFVCKNGKILSALVSAISEKDRHQRFIRSISVVIDVTEQRRTQASLQIRDRAIDASSQGISIVDADQPGMPVIYVNKGLEKLTGYRKEELLERNMRILQGADTDAGEIVRLQGALARGDGFEGEMLNYRKDGSSFWNRITVTPVRGRNGRLTHFIGVHADVTERKIAEWNLKRSKQQLRAMSARIHQLEEDQRRTIAAELHDRVGSTLSALNMNLAALQSHLPDNAFDKNRKLLEDAINLAREATVVTRDLTAELRPEILDEYGLLPALRWYGEKFSERTGITAVVNGDEDLRRPDPSVEIVLFRIAQEALNNAAKHSGAERVEISWARETGKRTRLRIADDGVGFDANRVRFDSPEGGFGLLTMRERAISLGARFGLSSDPGRGTQITIELSE